MTFQATHRAGGVLLIAVLAATLLVASAVPSTVADGARLHSGGRTLTQQLELVEGELQVLIAHTTNSSVSQYLLRTDPPARALLQLDIPRAVRRGALVAAGGRGVLASGIRVGATGTFVPSSPTTTSGSATGPRRFLVKELVILEEYSTINNLVPEVAASVTPGTAPAQMSVLVVILSACDGQYPPARTVEDLEKTLYDGVDSVQGFFSSCSYNKTEFSRATTRIVGPVPLACAGTNGPWTWSTTSCTYSDNMGVAEAADAWLMENGVDTKEWKYKSYILPANVPCPWTGLGHLGCSPTAGCRTWLTPFASRFPTAFAHELGHNLFLHHAGTPASPYQDTACSMGFCCARRCYNAPHMWQTGWAAPLAEISDTTLPPGTPRSWTLPAAHLDPNHMLRVQALWDPTAPTLYIALRASGGFAYDDASTFRAFADRVSVWRYNGVRQTDVQLTTNLAALGGDAPAWTGHGLVVRVGAIQGGYANVTLCRKMAEAEGPGTCADGLDNDCDGVADGDDSDCPAVAKPPPDGSPPPLPEAGAPGGSSGGSATGPPLQPQPPSPDRDPAPEPPPVATPAANNGTVPPTPAATPSPAPTDPIEASPPVDRRNNRRVRTPASGRHSPTPSNDPPLSPPPPPAHASPTATPSTPRPHVVRLRVLRIRTHFVFKGKHVHAARSAAATKSPGAVKNAAALNPAKTTNRRRRASGVPLRRYAFHWKSG